MSRRDIIRPIGYVLGTMTLTDWKMPEKPSKSMKSLSIASLDSSSRGDSDLSAIVMPLYTKFKDRSPSAPPPPSICSGIPVRSIVLLTLLSAVVMVTIGGGYLFAFIESANADVALPQDHCFAKVQKHMNQSTEKVLLMLRSCLERDTRIRSASVGFMYSWSLYTTAGYGNTYPHTTTGQMITTVFITLCVPLFMAFKIEFGQMSTVGVLQLAKLLQRLKKRFRGKVHADGVPPLPSDGLLVLTLSLVIVLYLVITTFVVVLLEGISPARAFYLTYISVFLVGLGDVTPTVGVTTFFVIFPLFLFGDAITAYLSYYVHGRFRIWAHRLAKLITGKEDEAMTSSKQARNGRVVRSTKQESERRTHFPTVTTTSMPMNIMACESEEAKDDADLFLGDEDTTQVEKDDNLRKF